jgi:hypothetical protein
MAEETAGKATLVEDIFSIQWNLKQERVTPIQARAMVQLAILDHLQNRADPYSTVSFDLMLDIIVPESKEVADAS